MNNWIISETIDMIWYVQYMQYFLLDVEFKVTFNPPKFCQLLTLHRAASIGMEPVSGGFELLVTS